MKVQTIAIACSLFAVSTIAACGGSSANVAAAPVTAVEAADASSEAAAEETVSVEETTADAVSDAASDAN